MAETRYRTVAQTQAGARVREVDEGLRSYMLRVYNYMASGLALSGIGLFGVAEHFIASRPVNDIPQRAALPDEVVTNFGFPC